MTVTTEPARRVAQGNGTGTVFGLDFIFYDADTLAVTLVSSAGVETPQVLGEHYTVEGGNGDEGSVVMEVAPAVGEKLVVERQEPYVQALDLRAGGPFNANTIEASLDRLTLQVQQLRDRINRAALRSLTATVDVDPLILPTPESGKVLTGREDEKGWMNADVDDLFGDASAISLPVSVANGGTGNSNAAAITKGDYAVATGSDNAFAVTLSPAPMVYAAGLRVRFRANHTIDGAATLNVNELGDADLKDAHGQALTEEAIQSGGVYEASHDGTEFKLTGYVRPAIERVTNLKIYTAGATWTRPDGLLMLEVAMVGGGGGGGGTGAVSTSDNAAAAGGGGGGEYAYARIPANTALDGVDEVTVTVGAGGAAGTAGENNGGNGGASSFGSYLTAGGGKGGTGCPDGDSRAVYAGGAGGTGGTSGDLGSGEAYHIAAAHGMPGAISVADGHPEVSSFGHGGRGGGPLGGGGAQAGDSAGATGGSYGGGGSGAAAIAGSTAARAGGAGAAGAVLVVEYTLAPV